MRNKKKKEAQAPEVTEAQVTVDEEVTEEVKTDDEEKSDESEVAEDEAVADEVEGSSNEAEAETTSDVFGYTTVIPVASKDLLEDRVHQVLEDADAMIDELREDVDIKVNDAKHSNVIFSFILAFSAVALIVIAFLIIYAAFILPERKAREGFETEVMEKLNNIDKNLNDLDSQVKTLQEDVDTQREDMKSVKKGLEENHDSITNLKKELEKQVDELNEKIKQVEVAKAEKRAAEEAARSAAASASYVTTSYSAPTGSGLTPTSGINNFNGHTESYYNLPMEKVIEQARNFGIEGEYWVRDDGVKMYGDYVMCACNYDIYPIGSLVETSFGTGISLDTGAFTAWNPTNVDIATAW